MHTSITKFENKKSNKLNLRRGTSHTPGTGGGEPGGKGGSLSKSSLSN